jgi:hypothetical protein
MNDHPAEEPESPAAAADPAGRRAVWSRRIAVGVLVAFGMFLLWNVVTVLLLACLALLPMCTASFPSRYIQYTLTERGHLLVPLLESLRRIGLALECTECEDRKERLGAYCEPCPKNEYRADLDSPPQQRPSTPSRREQDDSIVLL